MSLEPSWKVASIRTPHILIRSPWGRQNCFKPKRHYLVLAASEASKQDVWCAYGCNFSWRFQWHHRRPCPTSMAGDIADFLLSLAAPHLHGVLVVVNGNKFIAGVVDTGGDHWKSGGHWFMEKTWSRKSRVRLPLNIEAKRTVLAYNLSRSKQK